MARLAGTHGDGPVADRVRQRRNGTLRPIDTMLLYSPEIADGWNTLLGAIRERLSLPADLLEIVILRIGVLNRAEYEWESHVGPARSAGVTEPQLEALRQDNPAASGLFSSAQILALEYAQRMTQDIEVPNEEFAMLRLHFNEQEIVELTAAIAAYNMVSRFAVALHVSLNPNGGK